MPVSGAWSVSFSMESDVDTFQVNEAYLHLNDGQLVETYHGTYSSSGYVSSTSGRLVTLEASAWDSITLRSTKMDYGFYYINFCAEYNPKM